MPGTKKRVAAPDAVASPPAKVQKVEKNSNGVASSEENSLESLRKFSVVVADSGDFETLKQYVPHDATTNPSLLFKAASMPQYAHLVDKAIQAAKKKVHLHKSTENEEKKKEEEEHLIEEVIDQLFVLFGIEILKIVPGVVSTEVSAALSFDVHGSVEKARKLIRLYKEHGIEKERVLIKLATTWEGCEAAKILEKEGIHCNMTLLFSFVQAVAAAEAHATLISPFVGRILDWYKKAHPDKASEYVGDADPGVQSVKKIYRYYKHHGYKTIVMAASFRNIGEIIALAGCDKVTVSPALLEELKTCHDSVTRRLFPDGKEEEGENKEKKHKETNGSASSSVSEEKTASSANGMMAKNPDAVEDDLQKKKLKIDEKTFRWMLNEDPMATEKLAEGIRGFNKDLLSLKALVREKLKL